MKNLICALLLLLLTTSAVGRPARADEICAPTDTTNGALSLARGSPVRIYNAFAQGEITTLPVGRVQMGQPSTFVLNFHPTPNEIEFFIDPPCGLPAWIEATALNKKGEPLVAVHHGPDGDLRLEEKSQVTALGAVHRTEQMDCSAKRCANGGTHSVAGSYTHSGVQKRIDFYSADENLLATFLSDPIDRYQLATVEKSSPCECYVSAGSGTSGSGDSSSSRKSCNGGRPTTCESIYSPGTCLSAPGCQFNGSSCVTQDASLWCNDISDESSCSNRPGCSWY